LQRKIMARLPEMQLLLRMRVNKRFSIAVLNKAVWRRLS